MCYKKQSAGGFQPEGKLAQWGGLLVVLDYPKKSLSKL